MEACGLDDVGKRVIGMKEGIYGWEFLTGRNRCWRKARIMGMILE